MGLNFGNELLNTPGLYNDIGSLKERWNQDGSEVVNLRFATNVAASQHTVTSNKTLYVTQLFVSSIAAGGHFNLRDGGALGTIKITIYSPTAKENFPIIFDTPLEFETSLYCDAAGAYNAICNVNGWEE